VGVAAGIVVCARGDEAAEPLFEVRGSPKLGAFKFSLALFSLFRKFFVSKFGMEMWSFQTIFFVGLAVAYRDIVFAYTINFEARVAEKSDHTGPIGDLPPIDGLRNASSDDLARVFSGCAPGAKVGCPKLRNVVRYVNLFRSCRIVGVCQPILQVYKGPKRIERLARPCARRSNIQALTGRELNSRHQEVQLMMAGMLMANPKDRVLIDA